MFITQYIRDNDYHSQDFNNVENDYEEFRVNFSAAMMAMGAAYARLALAGEGNTFSPEVDIDSDVPHFFAALLSSVDQAVTYDYEIFEYILPEDFEGSDIYDVSYNLGNFIGSDTGNSNYDLGDNPIPRIEFSTRLLDAVSEFTTLTTEKHDPEFLEALLGVGKAYSLLNPEKNDSFFSSWLNKVWSAENETQLNEAIQEFDVANERLETPEQRLELLKFQSLLLSKLSEPRNQVDQEISGINVSIDKSLSLSALYAESKYQDDLKVIPEDLKFFDSLWEARHNSASEAKELISDSDSEGLRKSIEELCSETVPHTVIPLNDPLGYAFYPELLEDYPVSTCAINIGYALFSTIIQPVAPAVPLTLAFAESGVEFYRAITGEDLNGDDLSTTDRAWAFTNAITQTMLNLLEVKQVNDIIDALIGDLNIVREINMAAEDVSRAVSDAFGDALDKVSDTYILNAIAGGWATIRNLPPNMRVRPLSELTDPALDVALIRNELLSRTPPNPLPNETGLIKSKNKKALTVAAAKIETSNGTNYVIAISGGDSFKSGVGSTINIGGINYQVIRRNNGNAVSPSSLSLNPSVFIPNDQHPEQKIMDHLSQYQNTNIDVTIAVQNVSKSRPGLCTTCQATVPAFAANNPSFSFEIFEGSNGTRR